MTHGGRGTDRFGTAGRRCARCLHLGRSRSSARRARSAYVAISGASAGAINAVVFADGLLSGGRTGAQKALWAFWKAISRAAHGAQPANNPFYAFFLTTGGQLPRWLTSGPWAASIDAMAQVRGFPHTDFLSL